MSWSGWHWSSWEVGPSRARRTLYLPASAGVPGDVTGPKTRWTSTPLPRRPELRHERDQLRPHPHLHSTALEPKLQLRGRSRGSWRRGHALQGEVVTDSNDDCCIGDRREALALAPEVPAIEERDEVGQREILLFSGLRRAIPRPRRDEQAVG